MTVKLHKGKRLGNPRLVTLRTWFPSAASAGVRLQHGLRAALLDDGHAQLAYERLRLTGPEAHVLLGGVVEHKIITYYGLPAP
ncbi:MAG: hypothetical protein R2748_29570 [Bryobacterales bacterium]